MNNVWLVIAEAVYQHGVQYVATSEEAAREFCKTYAPDADGHHDWKIEQHGVGVLAYAQHRPANCGMGRGSGVTVTIGQPDRHVRVDYEVMPTATHPISADD